MSADHGDPQDSYKKAKDLKMIVSFEKDETPEGKMRVAQAKSIVCQLILLGQKRGRPSTKEENIDAAA